MPSSSVAEPVRRLGGWLRGRAHGIAAVTTALTFLLILLGEYTAASAAGATCGFDWPLCQGQYVPIGPGFGVHDQIEWFHRLVAMLTGYFIVGTGVLLWRRHEGTRVSRAGGLAAFLLPVQVAVGAVTVTVGGLVPTGYNPVVQALHYFTALSIFAALLAATTWAYASERRVATPGRVRLAALVGAASLPLHAAFARDLLVTFTLRVQMVYHVFGLLAFAALFVAALLAREADADGSGRVAAAAGGGAALLVLETLMVIGLFTVTPTVTVASYAVVALAFLAAVAAVALATRAGGRAGDGVRAAN